MRFSSKQRFRFFPPPRFAFTLLSATILLSGPAALAETVTSGPAAAAPPSPADAYGLWSLAPALVAILLAIATRQVIVSLALGILTAAGMMCALDGEYNPLKFVTFMMDRYVLGVLAPIKNGRADREHLTILIYTLLIGAMIGVLTANGGTRALVARVTRRVRTRQSAQLGAWFAGLLVFFDDYASAMIVGPGLRPIFDRLRLSREKLAHIVNWTAAPDSSIFLGTWLAVQVGWISEGLMHLEGRMPAFLANHSATDLFWHTIPFRTYTLLAMVMVFWVALTGRDFGGMRRAESGAAADPPPERDRPVPEAPPSDGPASHWALGAIPGLALIVLTVDLMAWTGLTACQAQGLATPMRSRPEIWKSLGDIFGNADSHFSLLYASLGAAALAVVMTVASRTLTLAKTMQGAVSGMSHMFAASIILVLAWGLSRASQDLQLGPVAEAFLQQKIDAGLFSLQWLPLAVFITACVISFSTGTSWGTMAILVPPIISISAGLFGGLPNEPALSAFYATLGAALAGAVFGNTCSPLADVTVLSAMFSGCDLAAHVRTVLPYALLVALVSVACTSGADWALQRWAPGFYPHWNVWCGLAAGGLLLLMILLVVGRRPKGVVIEPAVAVGA